ncbi:PREDICTED: elongation of very long chain fatty acids protein 6-like [Eurypyga helias]|nr:PREDICTED: elongation of very long chain fatty acids protein 6-like [Eurypyga helias]
MGWISFRLRGSISASPVLAKAHPEINFHRLFCIPGGAAGAHHGPLAKVIARTVFGTAAHFRMEEIRVKAFPEAVRKRGGPLAKGKDLCAVQFLGDATLRREQPRALLAAAAAMAGVAECRLYDAVLPTLTASGMMVEPCILSPDTPQKQKFGNLGVRKKSFLFSALYAAFIFGGRHLMNKRAKFELRKPLVLWSLSLAVFSIFGAVRTGAYMLYILMTKGLKQSVCDQSFYIGPVSKFWAYAFVLSKAPELGDTIFIILRKQKLIFLHWYHHITVLLYSWYSYKDMVAGGGWFMTMNYGVHAVMYSYYALRAAGFRVSRKFAMFITLSQITQMLIGCVVNYLVFSWMQQGQCHSHVQNIIWSSLMYLSYFVLFCHFFFEAYIGKTRKERKVD